MLTKRNIPLIIGFFAILLTLWLYFLTAGKREAAIDMWGISFILLAELNAIYGCIRLAQPDEDGRAKHMVHLGGGVGAFLLYVGGAVVLSTVFMLIFPFATLVLIALQVILIVVMFFAQAGFRSMGQRFTSQEHSPVSQSKNLLQQQGETVRALRQNTGHSAHRAHLDRLYDELRYSDDGKETELDEQLQTGIAELTMLVKEAAAEPVVKKVDDLVQLLKERKVLIAGARRG